MIGRKLLARRLINADSDLTETVAADTVDASAREPATVDTRHASDAELAETVSSSRLHNRRT